MVSDAGTARVDGGWWLQPPSQGEPITTDALLGSHGMASDKDEWLEDTVTVYVALSQAQAQVQAQTSLPKDIPVKSQSSLQCQKN